MTNRVRVVLGFSEMLNVLVTIPPLRKVHLTIAGSLCMMGEDCNLILILFR